MLAQRSVNYTHIEEDLAGLSDLVELADSIVEFVVVVSSKSRDPSLDFLLRLAFNPKPGMERPYRIVKTESSGAEYHGLTSFNDMIVD